MSTAPNERNESKYSREKKMESSRNRKITRKSIMNGNEKAKPAKAITRKSQSNEKKSDFFLNKINLFFLLAVLFVETRFNQH